MISGCWPGSRAMLCHFLLLVPAVLGQYEDLDPDMVGDIFGSQQEQEPYTYSAAPAVETRCDSLRPCVEGTVFHQYWKHFSSALECDEECSQWEFVNRPRKESVCTMQYEPQCGIDGKTYSNKCEATSQGVGVSCQGACPCPSQANVCSFLGNLDGDTICKAYKFVIEDSTVYVYRAPCLADDLAVNGGIWRGETSVAGYDTYPDGWGVLTYEAGYHLDREKYDGTMVQGVMQGYGNLFWKDGSLYSGQFFNNTKHGEGTLFYSSGDIFSGEWEGERKSGAGRYIFSQGGEYEGGFLAGEQEGQGAMSVPQEDEQEEELWEQFQGEYKGGERAAGEYRLPSGDTYSGDFEAAPSKYGGEGKYVWACGKVYSGAFRDGVPHGPGEMVYPSGYKYSGNFVAGRPEGLGRFSWSDTSYFDGQFIGGAMTGVGTYYLQDGGVFNSADVGSSLGLSMNTYYPDRDDLSVGYEATFDGTTLKYKKPEQQVKKGGYGK